MFKKVRSRIVLVGVVVAMVLTAGVLSACESGGGDAGGADVGGKVIDRSAEVNALWAADPASADWDMTIRGLVGQSKFTGEHDKDFTVYLTTFSSKKVPGFAVYQTIDVPNDDSMPFENRVTAHFLVVTGGFSLFPGVQDVESFMEWYAANMQGKYFLRLFMAGGGPGEGSSWSVFVSDVEPASSTTDAGYASTEIPLAFDEATGAWSVK